MDYYIILDLNIYDILAHYLFVQIKVRMIDDHHLNFVLFFELVMGEVFRGLGCKLGFSRLFLRVLGFIGMGVVLILIGIFSGFLVFVYLI